MKSIHVYILLASLLLMVNIRLVNGQPFELELQPYTINGLPGLHSFSSTTENGNWVLVGGRLNGLHGWQPPFAFPLSTQNTSVYVVDPVASQAWSASTNTLPLQTQEHICSSNQQSVRIGNYMYVIGGYGYNTAAGTMISFPNITAIDIPLLNNAIINQLPINSAFRTITFNEAAVTGGNARYFNNQVHLVFGHRFDGLYNPHNGPSFTQTYTDQIRLFNINDNGITFSPVNYNAITDTTNFHRRDYNLSDQILPGGTPALTAFSGVFRKSIDLPYYDNIDILGSGYNVNSSFEQKLNNYHSATIVCFDSTMDKSYTLFMGGMAQYLYDQNNNLLNDSLVPFVKTISMITREANGQFETNMPYEMPGYLGSNMEYFPSDPIMKYANGVLKYHEIDTGKVLIGYLFGGIESDYPYVFMQGGGSSWANDKVFKVFLKKNTSTTGILENEMIKEFKIFPNPMVNQSLTIEFQLSRPGATFLNIYDSSGKLISKEFFGELSIGSHQFKYDTPFMAPGVYQITLNSGGSFDNQKLTVTPR